MALWLATPAAGAAAATTMGVAASVHAPTGFFATEGGFEYPAVLGLAAASFTIGGPGPFSLDSLNGHVLDRPWMRAAALAVNRLPSRSRSTARCKALAEDTVAPASGTPVEEASAQPHTPPRVPFGGAKQSGYGLEFGVEGLKQLGAPQVIS